MSFGLHTSQDNFKAADRDGPCSYLPPAKTSRKPYLTLHTDIRQQVVQLALPGLDHFLFSQGPPRGVIFHHPRQPEAIWRTWYSTEVEWLYNSMGYEHMQSFRRFGYKFLLVMARKMTEQKKKTRFGALILKRTRGI